MMKNKKTISIKILLCIMLSVIIVTVIPGSVYAWELPDASVCDVDITTYSDPQPTPGAGSSGTVQYNNGKITLNDVKVEGDYINSVFLLKGGKIEFSGNNSISSTNVYGSGIAVFADLHLYGDGVLNLYGVPNGMSILGELRISSGTVNAYGESGMELVSGATITGGHITAKGIDYGFESLSGSKNIVITGGTVIAQGGKGAFCKQPDFGSSRWYKWRTSENGEYTDSNNAPYEWKATDTYVEIVPLTSTLEVEACDHQYEWVEDEAATVCADAKLIYKCRKCGDISMRMTEANSAFVQFNRDAADKIARASTGAAVTIDTQIWLSFHRTVIDALAKRPDVSLVLNYTDAKHNRRQITIPSGTDLTDFIDDNGYIGFEYLISQGLETDYWSGKLAK